MLVPIFVRQCFSPTSLVYLTIALGLAFLSTSAFAVSGNQFIPTIPGEERGLVCSGALGSDFNDCPTNFLSFAKSKSQITSQEADCQSPNDFFCFDELVVGVKDHFVFFDVDNNQTVKYEVTAVPNVFYRNGQIKHHGYLSAREVPPTTDELEVTELFSLVSENRKKIAKKITLTESADGTLVDENGHESDLILDSAESCGTAVDYILRESTCAGDLGNDIRRGIRDVALFYSTVNALEKLEVVLKVMLPEGFDIAAIEKLAEFSYIIMLEDGSTLVVDVKVKDGAIEIRLNEDASNTSDGRTFRDARNIGVSHSHSFAEANAIASIGLPMSHCGGLMSDKNLDEWVVVERIVTRDENGNERVRYIYRRKDNIDHFEVCFE